MAVDRRDVPAHHRNGPLKDGYSASGPYTSTLSETRRT